MTALGVVPPSSGAPFGSNGFGLATKDADHRAQHMARTQAQGTAHGSHAGTGQTAQGMHAGTQAGTHRARKHMARRQARIGHASTWHAGRRMQGWGCDR